MSLKWIRTDLAMQNDRLYWSKCIMDFGFTNLLLNKVFFFILNLILIMFNYLLNFKYKVLILK